MFIKVGFFLDWTVSVQCRKKVDLAIVHEFLPWKGERSAAYSKR